MDCVGWFGLVWFGCCKGRCVGLSCVFVVGVIVCVGLVRILLV